MPSVWFQIDGAWLEARAVDYLWNMDPNTNDCILFILPINSPMNILGMPMHVDYYSVHEPLTGKVTWAPHSASPKSNVPVTPLPSEKVLRAGAI